MTASNFCMSSFSPALSVPNSGGRFVLLQSAVMRTLMRREPGVVKPRRLSNQYPGLRRHAGRRLALWRLKVEGALVSPGRDLAARTRLLIVESFLLWLDKSSSGACSRDGTILLVVSVKCDAMMEGMEG